MFASLLGLRSRLCDRKEKKYEPVAPPALVCRKQSKQKGSEDVAQLPTVTPLTKCKLRLLKLERIKDYLLMEEEFVSNQERLKPQEDKNEEDRSKVDDLRGSPMSVGNLEELIDENHTIEDKLHLSLFLRTRIYTYEQYLWTEDRAGTTRFIDTAVVEEIL